MSKTTATPLTLALSKGRIFEETMPLLAAAGVHVTEDPETSRKLILPTSAPNLRVIVVRATDVPTYVEYGAADFGVAGKDVLLEHGGSGLYQPIDLNIACCRMSVAVKAGFDYANAVRQGARLRVATSSSSLSFCWASILIRTTRIIGAPDSSTITPATAWPARSSRMS